MEGGILPSTKQSSTLRVNFINLKPLLLLKYEMENFSPVISLVKYTSLGFIFQACDIKDPKQNIEWTVPEGGGGPGYSIM
ncbi:hypothetical protein RHGRI_025632 [Rhododendron griersonianum]|uniref:ETF-QO/FixX C-terminal domain-containing protein n=1 Tax=Rhododendron griersonianum TaxID=479676 RepID=A0AAV6IPU7_9ERIC|nr:hypothetical protein RHGRI_025632 [Rhododendron griersonianum]